MNILAPLLAALIGAQLVLAPLAPRPPFPGAPLCPDAYAGHDVTTYHGAWDDARGCFYTHTHGADPAALDAVLGGPVESWLGQEVGYAHTTSALENQHGGSGKHSFFTWLTYSGLAHLPQHGQRWVTDARIEVHTDSAVGRLPDGTTLGALSRFHSYALEARICDSVTGQCGVVRTGGHAGGHVVQSLEAGVRWCFNNQTGALSQCPNGGPSASRYICASPGEQDDSQIWYNSPGSPNPLVAQLTPEVLDPYSYFDRLDPYTIHLYGDTRPGNNGSRVGLHTLTLTVRAGWDQSQAPGVQWQGYLDPYSERAESCTQPSATCIWSEIDGAPAGQVQLRPTRHGIEALEFDTCAGSGLTCLAYPYE